MTISRRGWLGVVAIVLWPALGYPDPPPAGPTNNAVLLPPQTFDDSAKAPNNSRDSSGAWTIYGGVYLLQPVFQSNPAFVVSSGGGNLSHQVDFGYRLDVSPNIWLGYVNERGWGVRARWFEFDQTSSAAFGAAPGVTVTGMSPLPLGNVPVSGAVAATSRLAVDVIDLQATYTCETPRWTNLLGLGVRYTSMTQDYQASINAPATNINLNASHDLSGAGPCFSLETKYRLTDNGFSLYGQIYGAVVFGHASENYGVVNNGVVQQFSGNPTSILPVGEMELGAEYQKHLGRATLFIQAGCNAQIWFGGGNASNLEGVGASSATHNNFGFIGIALRAGVRY